MQILLDFDECFTVWKILTFQKQWYQNHVFLKMSWYVLLINHRRYVLKECIVTHFKVHKYSLYEPYTHKLYKSRADVVRMQGSQYGTETLVRWRHKTGCLVDDAWVWHRRLFLACNEGNSLLPVEWRDYSQAWDIPVLCTPSVRATIAKTIQYLNDV